MTATKTKPSTAVSDAKLLKALKDAHAEKGELPTGIDAEKRLYGLYPKRTYILRFGSWNAAMQKAGLPINPYKRGGQRADGQFNGRLQTRGPIGARAKSSNSLGDWIEERLSQIHSEEAALQRLAQLREEEAELMKQLGRAS